MRAAGVAVVRAPITAALTLYVTTAGNDLTGDGSIGNPYRNPQAALNSLVGVTLFAPVIVSVGAGTFDGFQIPTLVYVGLGSLTVAGTTANATLATGTATGTATATGSGTLTDSGQTWTADALAGKILQHMLAGVVTYSKIMSNTATVITLGPTSTPTAATTYAILDNVSVLTANAALPGSTTTLAVSIATQGNNGQPLANGAALTVKNFAISPSGATQGSIRIYGSGAQCVIDQCTINLSNGAHSVLVGGSVAITNCSFFSTAAVNPISQTAQMLPGNVTITTCYFNHTVSSAGVNVASGDWTISTCVFACTVASGSTINISTSAKLPTVNVSSCRFTSSANIVTAPVPCFVLVQGTPLVASSGNTNGIVASKGAHVQVASTVALGATNEISVDGSVTTLAAMRALTPKAYPASPNAYGTVVYE